MLLTCHTFGGHYAIFFRLVNFIFRYLQSQCREYCFDGSSPFLVYWFVQFRFFFLFFFFYKAINKIRVRSTSSNFECQVPLRVITAQKHGLLKNLKHDHGPVPAKRVSVTTMIPRGYPSDPSHFFTVSISCSRSQSLAVKEFTDLERLKLLLPKDFARGDVLYFVSVNWWSSTLFPLPMTSQFLDFMRFKPSVP